jgi:hypothetical protein
MESGIEKDTLEYEAKEFSGDQYEGDTGKI